jgi:HEAT repeat protein
VLAFARVRHEAVIHGSLIHSIGIMSATIPEAFSELERIASTSRDPSERSDAFTAAISNISLPADRNGFLQRSLSNDSSDYIRRAAASHLAANGQFTSDEALRRLAGTDDSIRCGIIEGLSHGGARHPWLTPELLRGVGSEQSEEVRTVFITHAAAFGPLSAEWNEPIVLLLNDVNSDIRRAAVQSVPLLEASQLPVPVVDAMVERTSDPVRDVALEAARATMRRAESFAHRQIQHAWEALAKHQPDEVKELSSSWNLAALHAILETDFIYIRRIAARRLIDGAANDRERLDRILSLQSNDRDAQLRALCSGLLGELIIQSDRITPALVHAGLHDPDRSVRAVALRAAENRRDSDTELVAALIEALKDPSPEVVLAAANSLARLGPRAAAAHSALVAAVDHPDANARTAIADALRKIQAE